MDTNAQAVRSGPDIGTLPVGSVLALLEELVTYDNGEGVPEDDLEAVRWYRLAADQGYVVGQSNLGGMYVDGRGVPQDYVHAHMWLNLAAAQTAELFRLAYVAGRDDVAERMTPEQLAEAQRRAREWTLGR